jgi:N6-adenosine-specific RNA methylase IME4
MPPNATANRYRTIARHEDLVIDRLLTATKRREVRQVAILRLIDDHNRVDPGPVPEGKYDVILADPPWRYDFAPAESSSIERHYPTRTVEEIIADPPDGAADAVLFLWATAPKLREALAVMEAWGFDYKTHAVWDKEKPGMGYWFLGQHELVLVGTRGKFSPPVTADRVPSVFRETRREHSRKPDVVYKWLERAFPRDRTGRVEMYARVERKDWTVWGNEV